MPTGRRKPKRIHTSESFTNSPNEVIRETFDIDHIHVFEPKRNEIITVGNITIKGDEIRPVLHENIDINQV